MDGEGLPPLRSCAGAQLRGIAKGRRRMYTFFVFTVGVFVGGCIGTLFWGLMAVASDSDDEVQS